MKATIRKPDGTVIEVEGTADEIARVAGEPLPPVYVPTVNPCCSCATGVNAWCPVHGWRVTWPYTTYTTTGGEITLSATTHTEDS